MHNELKSIGCHWFTRRANLGECADKLYNFLTLLRELNPELFSDWYKKGKSKKSALRHRVNITFTDIKDLLSKSNDLSLYPKTSFRASLWNGTLDDEKSYSISISIGSEEDKYYTNCCVFYLPSTGDGRFFFDNYENKSKVIDLLKTAWSPEWIQINNDKHYLNT